MTGLASCHLLARIPRWRQADMAGEGDAEGACRTINNAFSDCGDARFIAPHQALCHSHAPGEQICHRRDARGAAEAFEECRAGEGGLFRQLRNRPRTGRTFVPAPQGDREGFIGQPAQAAGRRRSPRRAGAEVRAVLNAGCYNYRSPLGVVPVASNSRLHSSLAFR